MIESNRDRHIYKVLSLEQWSSFQSETVFTGSPVDLADGYIHLSRASQLKVTLDKWYAEYEQVALLEIRAADLADTLKYEISRGGAEFPHQFGDLPFTSIERVWLVSPKNGVYSLPEDLAADSKASDI